MDFPKMEDLVRRLRTQTPEHTMTALDLEAAVTIDSLLFQLNARIEKEPA